MNSFTLPFSLFPFKGNGKMNHQANEQCFDLLAEMGRAFKWAFITNHYSTVEGPENEYLVMDVRANC